MTENELASNIAESLSNFFRATINCRIENGKVFLTVRSHQVFYDLIEYFSDNRKHFEDLLFYGEMSSDSSVYTIEHSINAAQRELLNQ